MSTIAEIHTETFELYQTLIPKSVVITFPNDNAVSNTNLRGKRFKFTSINVSSISEKRMKTLNSDFTNEAFQIMILNDTISATQDLTSTVNAPLSGYKSNNAIISYKGKTYVMKDEIINPFDNSITLFVDKKG